MSIETNTAAIAAAPDTGETIARLLIKQGLITEKQLKHAQRVRAKLAHPKTLLNTMLELEYFSNQQFTKVLRTANLDIRLGDLLVELGVIKKARELDTAMRLQRDQPADAQGRKKKLGEILIDVFATHLGYLHIEPDFSTIDKTLLTGISAAQCEHAGFIPVRKLDDTMIVACIDPKNAETQQVAEQLLNTRVKLAICSRNTLAIAINKFKSVASGRSATAAADDSRVSLNSPAPETGYCSRRHTWS